MNSLKKILAVGFASLLLMSCQPLGGDSIRVEMPIDAQLNTDRVAIIVIEKNGTTWRQTDTLPLEVLKKLDSTSPQPQQQQPPFQQQFIPMPVPAPPDKSKPSSKCGLFVMPDIGMTPALPVLLSKEKVDDKELDAMSYGYIGQLRQYISGMKKQLKTEYSKYLAECNKLEK